MVMKSIAIPLRTLDHGALTGVLTAQHHTLYTDAEALAAGARVIVDTLVPSGSPATLGLSGINDDFDLYEVGWEEISPVSDGVALWLRVGDSGGIDIGAADYGWVKHDKTLGATTYASSSDSSDSRIRLVDTLGNLAAEAGGGSIFIPRPGGASNVVGLTGSAVYSSEAGTRRNSMISGFRLAAIDMTQVQFHWSSGNFVNQGRVTLWGIRHE